MLHRFLFVALVSAVALAGCRQKTNDEKKKDGGESRVSRLIGAWEGKDTFKDGKGMPLGDPVTITMTFAADGGMSVNFFEMPIKGTWKLEKEAKDTLTLRTILNFPDIKIDEKGGEVKFIPKEETMTVRFETDDRIVVSVASDKEENTFDRKK